MNNSSGFLVLMGVSGCGKTTVGEYLSEILDWPFFDGDDFHPPENVAKMAEGIPLNDDDRAPWLKILHDLIAEKLVEGKPMLLACSALKQKYRDQLTDGNLRTVFVYLKGDFELVFERTQARAGHYMKAEMLRSQFESLEEPEDAITVNIDQSVKAITEQIIQELPKDILWKY